MYAVSQWSQVSRIALCEVPSELPTTFASPPTSSTSTWTEEEREEFGKLDESQQMQQIYDFLKSQSAEQSLLSQAQVVIKEKLSNISDVLNTCCDLWQTVATG